MARAQSADVAAMSKPQYSRPKIPIRTQVDVLFRGGWLCSLCHRPTVFPLAMKYLTEFVQGKGYVQPIAYYDFRWRRDAAPLLDHLACVIDHVAPFSRGGAHDAQNFAVACNKCNVRKNSASKELYLAANPSRRVRGKYGEPKHWDGLASVFIVLGREARSRLTRNELQWLEALEEKIRPESQTHSGLAS